MTRAQDRLYICGAHNNQQNIPEDCWYAYVSAALEKLPQSQQADLQTLYPHLLPTNTDSTQVLFVEKRQGNTAPDAAEKIIPALPNAKLPHWTHTTLEKTQTLPRLRASQIDLFDGHMITPLEQSNPVLFTRGSLIHRLLQLLPDYAPAQRREIAEIYVRQHGGNLPQETREEIIHECLAVFDTPELTFLFSESSRAEVPVIAALQDGVLSGQIDRLVLSGDEIYIIDYKTNQKVPDRAEDISDDYVKQMRSYKNAVEKLYPGKHIRCGIVWTRTATLMRLPQDFLKS